MKWGADSVGVWMAAWGCRFSLHRMRSVHAGLRFFSLGVGGEEEWGEKGWQVSGKGPTSLLDALTPGPVSSHEITLGQSWRPAWQQAGGCPMEPKVCWPLSDSAKGPQQTRGSQSNRDSETSRLSLSYFLNKSSRTSKKLRFGIWSETDLSWNLASPILKTRP